MFKTMDEMNKVCPMCQGENCECKCEGCGQKATECTCPKEAKCEGCNADMGACTCAKEEEKCGGCHNTKSACTC